MMKRNWFSVAMLVALLLGVSTSSFAISLELTAKPNGPTGPYKFTITGDVEHAGLIDLFDGGTGTVWGVCNDISGGLPSGSWEVEKHALTNASLDAGHLGGDAKFYGPNPSPFLGASQYEYRIGAWLADQVLLGNNATLNQLALWGLFKTDAYQGSDIALARTAAKDAVDGGWDGWRNFAVNTRTDYEGPAGGTQEIYIRVPEAASFASLGLYFGGLGLLGYAFRRRMK